MTNAELRLHLPPSANSPVMTGGRAVGTLGGPRRLKGVLRHAAPRARRVRDRSYTVLRWRLSSQREWKSARKSRTWGFAS